MIYTLEGDEALCIVPGEVYKVPCVKTLPVVLPAHVDYGDDGPTGRHWHADARFPYYLPWTDFDDRSLSYFKIHYNCERHTWEQCRERTVGVPVVRDEGEEIVYQEKVAALSFYPTGAVFGSLVALYTKLGTKSASNRKCAHHATPLMGMGSCLVCPAHGMQYTEAGGPRFIAPFFLHAQNSVGDIIATAPAATGSTKMDLHRSGAVSRVSLADSHGEEVSGMPLDVIYPVVKSDTFTVNLGSAWPKESFCASFRK